MSYHDRPRIDQLGKPLPTNGPTYDPTYDPTYAKYAERRQHWAEQREREYQQRLRNNQRTESSSGAGEVFKILLYIVSFALSIAQCLM